MPDVQITDPLGRTITLHERTWYGHILKAHPEMDGMKLRVEEVVGSPAEIRHSNSDPDCRLYYGPAKPLEITIMVVVDVALALVKTAHFARRVSGGAQEWSR